MFVYRLLDISMRILFRKGLIWVDCVKLDLPRNLLIKTLANILHFSTIIFHVWLVQV
jgi:hypothetical protein